MDKRSSVYTRF